MTMNTNCHLRDGAEMAVDRVLGVIKFGDLRGGEVNIFMDKRSELFKRISSVMIELGAVDRRPLRSDDAS